MGKVRVKCWPGLRFTRYDLIALLLAILIPVTAIILIMVSILPALGAPALPSFDEPIKGFEPRGTELSDRIITLRNFYDEPSLSWYLPSSSKQGQVSIDSTGHQPKHSTAIKRRRRSLTGSLEPPLCTYVPFDNMVFVFKTPGDSGDNLLDANRLRSICAMETEIVRQSPNFELSCLAVYDGSKSVCCSSWSLGNYVALLNNRKSCQDITNEDVTSVKNLLRNCSSYFLKQILRGNCSSYSADPSGNATVDPTCASIPLQCVKYNAVYNIFQYLTDNQFMSTPNDGFLKYSAVLTPVNYDIQFYEEVYNAKLKEGLPATEDIELAGFEFGFFKFDQFNVKLIAEVAFPALAMIVVFAIMWFFLGSFILTFCGLFCIIYAIGLSYFLYTIVFKIEFFPFLNLTTFIFLVGIGADDAFVYYDIWRQTKAANPNANVMQLTLKTLRYAALSMLVTSLTTASAFLAGVSSTITAIKCFGIFAGTSILTNYLLMITYFPAVVVLHERWVLKYTGGQGSDGVMPSEMALKEGASYPAPDSQDISDSREADGIVTSSERQESKPFCVLQIIDFPCLLLVSAKRSLQRASSKMFEHWLPLAVIKLHWLWIALFVCLTAGFLVVCFVKPGLQTPSSTEFQVFGSSHPLEQYSLHYKSSFRFEQKNGGLTINLMWGIKPVDNGNYLNADDKGTLQFDETFGDLFSPDGQQFMRSLCQSAEQQPFFARFNTPDGKCPIDILIKGCLAGHPCCGNHTVFPFPTDVTKTCILHFAESQQTGIFFDASSGKVLGYMMVILSNQPFTTAFDPMDNFWKKVSSWANTEMAKAPPGLRNGWASSWGIDHYALQVGLSEGTYSSMGISVAVSFSIMLLTTLNIFISIYAIITIIGIIAITVGSLVLAGWQLNILESIVMSVAVGLSIDFTMHYGVAYRLAPDKSDRQNRVRYSLVHIGSAITMAAVTTFLTGVMMMPATVLAYYQLGQFLMLVMVFSWLYATFAFLSICAVIGPKGQFGQLSVTNLFRKCGLCRVKPDNSESHQGKPELDDVAAAPDAAAPEQADSITTPL